MLELLFEGKIRVYYFNPRYPFLKELKSLLEKAYIFLPKDYKDKYYEPRIIKKPQRKEKNFIINWQKKLL